MRHLTVPIAFALVFLGVQGLQAQTELEELRALVQKLQADLQQQSSVIADLVESNRSLVESSGQPGSEQDLEDAIINLIQSQDASRQKSFRQALEPLVFRIVKIYPKDVYERGGIEGDDPSIFKSLTGGLVFTGSLRSRLEYRANNIDFAFNNPRTVAGSNFDDEGYRFNGRFRLGFGAVFLPQGEDGNDAIVEALTQFQAYGSFANNSFVNQLSPSGISNPSAFSILSEPFETVSLYQGYLRFRDFFAEDVDVTIGRQEIVLGNQFLLGRNGFFDGTVHDGLLTAWDIRPKEIRLTAFLAKEAASDGNLGTAISDFDEDMFTGLYVTWMPNEDLSMVIDAYALYFDARSSSTDLFRTGSTASFFDGAVSPTIDGQFWTLGSRFFMGGVDALGGSFSFNLEAAYQTGSNHPDGIGAAIGTNQSLHGFGLEFITNFRFEIDRLPSMASLSYYFASGGNSSGTHVGFQPLFPNRHFDYGRRTMRRPDQDEGSPYMLGGGRYGNLDIIPLNNVHILKAAFAIEPSPETELGLAYVLGITADNEGYGSGIYGHEIDVFGRYSPREFPNLHFSGNLSVFIPEDTATGLSSFLFTEPGSPALAGDDVAIAIYFQALIEF